VFKDKCTRCHGPGGLGDGPDSDHDAREDMDLTNPKRADRNSEGEVFYKVWNGRRRPKMPAFKEELTEQQAWAVVAYAQTLRKAQ
jgi:mono/diheme cytochrome c family protein